MTDRQKDVLYMCGYQIFLKAIEILFFKVAIILYARIVKHARGTNQVFILLSMFKGFDVKSQRGFYGINIFSIKFLQNCCFSSVIKTSEKRC